MSYPIIYHEGAYNLWNTEWDKPCFEEALSEAELTAYIKENYGEAGLRQLPPRMERARALGTSHMLYKSLKSLIENNRAGLHETKLPPETIIQRHLTIRTAPRPRRYTVTCVCGISVQTTMVVRLKDVTAFDHEGSAHVRRCPACSLIPTPPAWWLNREPAVIPEATQAVWDAADQTRRDRIRAAAERLANRNKAK